MLPVPDAALGATGYAAEILAGVIGGADRWRRHPKLVIAYGAVVAGVGLTALSLAAVQAFHSSRLYALPALGRDLLCCRLARAR